MWTEGSDIVFNISIFQAWNMRVDMVWWKLSMVKEVLVGYGISRVLVKDLRSFMMQASRPYYARDYVVRIQA